MKSLPAERIRPPGLRGRLLTRWLAAVVLLLSVPTTAWAQEAACTYDSCALRLRTRFFGPTEIVRGLADEPVAAFGLFGFAPHLAMLADRADSAGVHYRSFRAMNNRGAWLQILGGAATAAGMIVVATDGDEGVAIGLVLGGSVPLIWGSAETIRGRDRLSRAIWWYNRSLDAEP